MNRRLKLFLLTALVLPSMSFAQSPQVDSSEYDNPYRIHNSLYVLFQRAQKFRAVEKCLDIADSMAVYARQLGDTKAEVLAMTVPLNFASGQKDLERTISCADALKAKALETGYTQYYYYACQSEISLLLTKSRYLDAKDRLDELETYLSERNDPYGQSICKVLMGHFYHHRLNYELAIRYYLEAAHLIEESVPGQSAAGSYTHASDAALKAEMYEEALEYSEKGLQCICSNPTKLNLMDHRTAALFFLKRNDEFVKSFREYDKAHKEYGNSAREHLHVSNILWDTFNGNPKVALSKLEDIKSNRAFMQRIASEVYISMGDYKSAAAALKEVNRYQASAHNLLEDSDLAEMGARYDNMNLRAENAELELEKEQIRSRTILILGICFGFVLLSAFLFFILSYIRRHKADAERVNFLVNVGHELRTPLTLIIGPLNRLISSDKTDDATRDKLKMVIMQAERMKTLTHTITSVGDLRGGTAVLHKTLVGFNDWVERNAEALRTELDTYQIELDYIPEQKFCILELDEDLADIAFANMMRNVIRSSEAGTTIILRTERRSRTARVVFEYSGLPTGETNHKNVFNNVYRTTDVKSGNSIGMASCKTILECHGGSVGAVDSRDGRGASMWLEFPLSAR